MEKHGAEKYAHLLNKNTELLSIIKKEGSKWKDIEAQLHSKQNMITKLMKEIDEKTASLKLSAAEVIDIKRKISVMKNENVRLEQQNQRMKMMEPQIVTNRKDLQMMDDEEVKNRILEISQAYRGERKRNEKLEKTLKRAQKDIAGRTHLITKMKGADDNVKAMDRQLGSLTREFKRTSAYKETISKQEAMILKLESILKNMASDTKNVRNEYKVYEKAMMENAQLKKQMNGVHNTDTLEMVLKSKAEIKAIDREINNLRAQLSSQDAPTVKNQEIVSKRLDMEIGLERELTRAECLEEEINLSAQKFSRQIVGLKAGIEEKNAFLRSIGMYES